MMLQKTAKTPSVLNKLATLTTIRDVEVFELSVLKTLAELLKIQQLSMYKLDANHSSCRLLTYTSEVQQTLQKRSISESQEIHITEMEIPPHIKQAHAWISSTNKPYTSIQNDLYLYVYPIIGINIIVGYITLKVPKKLTETDALVITSLLSISHNFHSLLEENQKDKLTGLLNRKTFEDSIGKIQKLLSEPEVVNDYPGENNREQVSSEDFWLAMMDIDFFKRINDNFGHVYGDEVLLLLSQIMKQSFRNSDLMFRFGGEEFIVIIRASSKETATLVLERFRFAVENYPFPQIGTVTISIGVTKVGNEHVVPAHVVGRADQALYFAKEQGRNQLHFYEDLVISGLIKEKIEEGSIELF